MNPDVLLSGIIFLPALGALILAFLDYGFQLWKFEQDLKMTKQEVRDEMKNMEGDPLIRQQRREAHRKLATSREMQQVTEADAKTQLLRHQSITNWVVTQQTLLHLSQMLEVIAGGGQLRPTYGTETSAHGHGSLVDEAA